MVGSGEAPVGLTSAGSHDSLLADQNSSSETGDSPVLDSKIVHVNGDSVCKTSPFDSGNMSGGNSKVLNRTSSEKMKGAKGFLKRMESLKRSRSKKHRTIEEIGSPVVTNNAAMQAKIRHLNCQDINLVNENAKSPVNQRRVPGLENDNSAFSDRITSPRSEALTVLPTPTPKTDSNSNTLTSSPIVSHSSPVGVNVNVSHVTSTPRSGAKLKTQFSDSVISGNNSGELGDLSLFSTNGALPLDSSLYSRRSSEATNSSEETVFLSGEHKPGKFPTRLDESLFGDSSVRTRSFSYTDDSVQNSNVKRRSLDPRKQLHRVSIYDNVPIEEDLTTAQQELDIILSELFQNINGLNRAINGDNAGRSIV